MPIYAYRCAACGHAQDVLQKMSDPLLSVCPACSAASFEKQLTAAGFQLKGSGWYVTDFRNGNTGAAAKKDGDAKEGDANDGKDLKDASTPAAADAAGKVAGGADAPAAPATVGKPTDAAKPTATSSSTSAPSVPSAPSAPSTPAPGR